MLFLLTFFIILFSKLWSLC